MESYHQEILKLAQPLNEDKTFSSLIDSLKSKKIVMLGESSHGTHEFYEWRIKISQELVRSHGFNFIAVEGDWPPCQVVNEFVQGKIKEEQTSILTAFNRWPTWMWANTEMESFIHWLRDWNETNRKNIGFHGLDVYSLYESMDQVILKLREINPRLAREAEEKYSCLESYRHDEKSYAYSLFKNPHGCEKEILHVLNQTLMDHLEKDYFAEALFDARQNAKIVKNAENYYRTMVFGEGNSWNVRDRHMMSTLETLLNHYGNDSKAIVWEHNTHIGDYRATNMLDTGEVNLGGLAREQYGKDEISLVGFGTDTGTVTASYSWDGPTLIYNIPHAVEGSVEHACRKAGEELGHPDFLMHFDSSTEGPLSEIKGHRAIGVVYDPDIEHGNFVPTKLEQRYDTFIFMKQTTALTPLNVCYDTNKFPETYPFGNKL